IRLSCASRTIAPAATESLSPRCLLIRMPGPPPGILLALLQTEGSGLGEKRLLLRFASQRPEGPRRGRQAFALHVRRPPPAATASSFSYAQRPPGHDGARLAEPSVTERCSAELARLRFFPTHRHPTHRRRISAALPHLGEEPKKSP